MKHNILKGVIIGYDDNENDKKIIRCSVFFNKEYRDFCIPISYFKNIKIRYGIPINIKFNEKTKLVFIEENKEKVKDTPLKKEIEKLLDEL